MDNSLYASSDTDMGQDLGYSVCYHVCFPCLKVDYTSQSPHRDVVRLLLLKFAKIFAVRSGLTDWNWRAVQKCQVFLLSYSSWGQIFHMPVLSLWDMWLLSHVVMGHIEDKAGKMQAGKQTVTLTLQKNKIKSPSKTRVLVNKRTI